MIYATLLIIVAKSISTESGSVSVSREEACNVEKAVPPSINGGRTRKKERSFAFVKGGGGRDIRIEVSGGGIAARRQAGPREAVRQ